MNKHPEYIFKREIKAILEVFRNHLKGQHLDTNTIHQKCNYAGYFLSWTESEQLLPEEVRYNDLLSFIDYCKLEDKPRQTINSMLRSVRNYYEFLKLSHPSLINPAASLYLKGTRKTVVSNIIAFERLEELYRIYPNTSLREKRNKIILSLLVYQGVDTGELGRLEVEHIKLREGKIYIPGGHKSNHRTLELKSFQLRELQKYVTHIRAQILEQIGSPKPARKPEMIHKEKIESQLFISINGSENIKNSLLHLFRDVRRKYPEIKNAGQIRQSVIVHWLKTMNLRQVQYMAGHKYVSSTERYKMNNLVNLQNKLEKLHPLGKIGYHKL